MVKDERTPLFKEWLKAAKRANAYLNDPANPINNTWIRLFNSMADRVGIRRGFETDSTIEASVGLLSGEMIAQAFERHRTQRLIEEADAAVRAIGAGDEAVADAMPEEIPLDRETVEGLHSKE